MAVKDDTKVMTHAMPNLVIGCTEVADNELRRSLYDLDHGRFIFEVGYFPNLNIN